MQPEETQHEWVGASANPLYVTRVDTTMVTRAYEKWIASGLDQDLPTGTLGCN